MPKVKRNTAILGAGMTGLAAGFASGLPVYESAEIPGGLCASYYVRPGETRHYQRPPADDDVYRFEIGGGHWIWGGDPLVLQFIEKIAPFKQYVRMATAYLADQKLHIPYPIQYNLKYLGDAIAFRALSEMTHPRTCRILTMADWLKVSFGSTLDEIFFSPFHKKYTAGVWDTIAPQDPLKSPVDLERVIAGAMGIACLTAGYNAQFSYPVEGLNQLAQLLAGRSDVHYGKRVVHIDTKDSTVIFSDSSILAYDYLICTLPLDRTLRLAGITLDHEADPFTSVLVINIGAKKGSRCPREHWVYIPTCDSGLHRVGFYSNVDRSFLPRSVRSCSDHVALYAEISYMGGNKPSDSEMTEKSARVVAELQAWDWIGVPDVVDATWVETAYTWNRPDSRWVQNALNTLLDLGIYQVGRYGQWASGVANQSIASSIKNGLIAGATFR